MSSIPECPWPLEPHRIIGARTPLAAYQQGGPHTNEVLSIAEKRGYLTPPHGVCLHIDVRCSFQERETTQHYRDAWHFDEAWLGWIWVEGPGRTQMRKPNGTERTIPEGEWVAYHGVEHRCPPQDKRGWRYFVRILWCDSYGQHLVQETPASPPRPIR
jgi:hypothetical protein